MIPTPINTPTPPAGVDGLVLHFDAKQISLNDNDAVSQWDDVSGSGANAVQANATYQPVYKATEFSGFPCVYFSTTATKWLDFGATDLSSAFSYFVVYKRPNVTVDAQIMANGAGGQQFMMYGSDWWLGSAKATIAQTNDVAYLYSATFSDTAANRWLDGVAAGTTAGGSASHYTFHFIGYGFGAYDGPCGYIAEIMVYDSVLSDGDRESVETFLEGRWFIPSPTPTP